MDRVTQVKSQTKRGAGVLTRAFHSDPLWAYFFPQESQRSHKLFHTLHMLVRYGVMSGEVHGTSPEMEGVAVWLPSDKADMSPWKMMLPGGFSAILKMGAKGMARSMQYTGFASDVHQQHVPFLHWYLQLIGVDPEFQGNSYGSELLKPKLPRLDSEEIPCFLETQNQENVPFYEHYGFQIVQEATVPGTNIGYWAMLRSVKEI